MKQTPETTSRIASSPVGDNESNLRKLQRLLAMPVAQRIEAVVKDLVTREDEFREIEAHDLADALGVSDSREPGSANRWNFTAYGVKVNIEEYADLHDPASELVYLIQDKVSAERFRALVNLSSDLDQVKKPDFHFLTPEERKLLEEAIGSEELTANQANGMCCIAHYSVQAASGYSLSFEADIEDDGACIKLRTPYDYRDGKFLNLNDCVTILGDGPVSAVSKPSGTRSRCRGG